MRIRKLALPAMLIFLAIPALGQQTPAERARAEQAAGQFATAGLYWRQALEKEPDNVEALAGLCDSLSALGRWRECMPHLEHLVALRPDNGERIWQLGQMKVWSGGADRARGLELMKRAMDMLPESADRRTTFATVLTWDAATREQGMAMLREILSKYIAQDEARRSLARALSWQGQHSQAIAALQPLTSRANSRAVDFMQLAELQAAAGNHSAEVEAYRLALQLEPENFEVLLRLAPILSWDTKTRGEAAQLYERAIKLQPENETLVTQYAEMLSWDGATRNRSVQMFDRALAMNSNSMRARIGKAQALSWSGRTQAALAQYNQVLAQEPKMPAALRGKATLLMWRQQHKEAREMLLSARAAAPGEAPTLVELARADVGVRRFEEARDTLSGLPQQAGEDWPILQRDVRQGLGTYLELGFGLRRSSGNLDYNRAYAAVSTPIGEGSRLTARFRPTLFDTKPGDFNSNYYALALDARLSDTSTLFAEVGGETFPRTGSSSVDGVIEIRARLARSFRLYTGFRRASVDESRTAARGVVFGGTFIGQVRSNLGSISSSYSFDAKKVDLSVTYTDGVYTGHNLDSNRRQAVDFNIGKTLRGFRPYFRVAYGFSFLHFDHDSSFAPGGGPLRRAGNYYSPYQSIFNYGGASMNYRFGSKVEWGAGGTAGVSTTRGLPLLPWDSRFNGSFSTNLTWHITDSNTIRINYDYIDVFNAFRYNLFGISWRHYF
jgi:tetratricopeptide (TPR) repeat protein